MTSKLLASIKLIPSPKWLFGFLCGMPIGWWTGTALIFTWTNWEGLTR